MPTRLVGLSCLLLAGLAGTARAAPPDGRPYYGGSDNFGEANRMTMDAQIIDPAPLYSTLVPESSGEHAAQAIERFRTDTVKKPVAVKASKLGAEQSDTTPE
ncbi:hypothetical protein [Sphingomonas oryzagri]|jgi:hypothetical protein|uniref:DUF4148 domain-containing protein n=1 Tax=Sphingomonas oryzagri TaxID=3042314 RepID=A0ABT6MWF6_9SPHN|nr:hypothetical protein [Sphingomonas oryzagri]MDH7637327.1 hypothetical protein [Sphingomonas oryzagri]